MMFDPKYPPAKDADPAFLALQQEVSQDLTVEEFYLWVNQQGMPTRTPIDLFRELMVGHKILVWFQYLYSVFEIPSTDCVNDLVEFLPAPSI